MKSMPLLFKTLLVSLFIFCVFNSFSQTNTNPVVSSDSTKPSIARDEKEAYYRGGEKAWMAFLSEHIDIRVAQKKAPAGRYSIIIQFIVGLDGSVTDIEPLSNNGYGMEEAVMKAIKKSPLWVPATQDGKTVKVYRKQPITFEIEDRGKKKKD